MATLEITYDPVNGAAIPDGKVEQIYTELVKHTIAGAQLDRNVHVRVTFSTENIFHRLRLARARDEFGFTIIFRYGDEEIVPNQYGAISSWPNGFCDCTFRLSEQILREVTAAKKKEHRR